MSLRFGKIAGSKLCVVVVTYPTWTLIGNFPGLNNLWVSNAITKVVFDDSPSSGLPPMWFPKQYFKSPSLRAPLCGFFLTQKFLCIPYPVIRMYILGFVHYIFLFAPQLYFHSTPPHLEYEHTVLGEENNSQCKNPKISILVFTYGCTPEAERRRGGLVSCKDYEYSQSPALGLTKILALPTLPW